MYSRSFINNEGDFLPDGYSGTLLSGDLHTEEDASLNASEPVSATPKRKEPPSLFPDLFGLFGRGKGSFGIQLGKEEILIIAAALFLFFSEWADRECAILLIIFLFIN